MCIYAYWAKLSFFSIQVIDKMSMWICVTLHIFAVATLAVELVFILTGKCNMHWENKEWKLRRKYFERKFGNEREFFQDSNFSL